MPKKIKYYDTGYYRWQEFIGRDIHNKERYYYYLWGRTNNGFYEFTYYPNDKYIKIDQRVNMYCESIERANQIVNDVLKVTKFKVADRFKGRYLKIKKINESVQ